jgi:hypothetical protein
MLSPAVCGNSICEYGEQCTNPACSTGCPADCPALASACPYGLDRYGTSSVCSGNGACQRSSGRCACFAGYTGNLCSVCTSKYMQVTVGGACIYLPGALTTCVDGVRNGNEEGVDCGGPNCVACTSTSMLTATATAVAFAGMGVLFSVLIGTYLWRRRQRRQASASVAPTPVVASARSTGKRVSLKHARTVVLGRQHSRESRRRSSAVMPSITIDWTVYERRPSVVGGHPKGEIL